MSNFVSSALSVEDQARALKIISELNDILGFTVKLTNDQKKAMPMIDDGRLPFVEKGLQFGTQESRVVPPFTDITELSKDLSLYRIMGPLEQELVRLTEKVCDTRMAAGSDAYLAALSIYNSAKNAVKMNVPGTQTIVDEMGKLFDGQGKSKKEVQATK